MKVLHNLVVLAATSVALINPVSAAEPRVYGDARAAVAAFNETCRKGFPTLDKIAEAAAAAGWQRTEVRLIQGQPDQELPLILVKGGLKLFLFTPSSGEVSYICQIIGGEAPKDLHGADFVPLLSDGMNGAVPVIEQSKTEDTAIWQYDPHLRVTAGVNSYRKYRSIFINASLR